MLVFLRSNQRKTHTMLGGPDEQSRGIILRAVEKVVEASKINEVKGWTYTMKARRRFITKLFEICLLPITLLI